MDNYVPSPDEVQRAVDRVSRIASVTFDIELGTWRSVFLTEAHPQYNQVRPDLTIIYYRPVLLVPTPYMPTIEAWLALSLGSLDTKRATLIPIGSQRGHTTGFRPNNEQSERWLRLQFARAQGMNFRSHGMVNTDKVIYTKEA